MLLHISDTIYRKRTYTGHKQHRNVDPHCALLGDTYLYINPAVLVVYTCIHPLHYSVELYRG